MNKVEKEQQEQIKENKKEHQRQVQAMHKRLANSKKGNGKSNIDLLQETQEREIARDKAKKENKKEPKPKFKIVVMIAVWAMIIFTLLSMTLGPISELFQSY